MKASIFIARFPYQGSEHPDVTDFLVETVCKMKTDPRISDILFEPYDDTPITMTRNRALKDALECKADFCLMVDSDMSPDVHNNPRKKKMFLPFMKPFWQTSFDFALNHRGPCVVGAPYCGPPPDEVVYIFHWRRYESDHPNADLRLEMISREQAALRMGFEQVAALPTGLMLIDLRAMKELPPPWFDYEWTDVFRTHKASTEDVYFTRNLSLIGVPQYVNWDAWAGHWKQKCVRRPTPLTSDSVAEQLHEAIKRGHKAGTRLVFMGEGNTNPPPPETNVCSLPKAT